MMNRFRCSWRSSPRVRFTNYQGCTATGACVTAWSTICTLPVCRIVSKIQDGLCEVLQPAHVSRGAVTQQKVTHIRSKRLNTFRACYFLVNAFLIFLPPFTSISATFTTRHPHSARTPAVQSSSSAGANVWRSVSVHCRPHDVQPISPHFPF
jgi:hypothetical protein